MTKANFDPTSDLCLKELVQVGEDKRAQRKQIKQLTLGKNV